MAMKVEHYLRVQDLPELREPVLLTAFSGWNDAARVATSALLALCRLDGVLRFADIRSEEFFVFTETRPTISLDPAGQRSVQWPANRFFSYTVPSADHDVVLLIGTEPQLKWETFCRVILSMAERLGVSSLITLGGLLADVPHTLTPRLTGFASDRSLVPQLEKLDVSLSSYEGPTGIVGALHDTWRYTNRPAFSLWGNVPHYISASPNPQISLALLQRVSGLLGTPLPVETLESEAKKFRADIDEAVAQNPEALEYVRQLEAQYASDAAKENTPELLSDLEQFLRSRRPKSDE